MTEEKEKCPLCNYQLSERWEGLVCKNWKCKLYFKVSLGWVKLIGNSQWSKQRMQVNGFYNANSRLFSAQQFAEVKRLALLRDNYTCQKCKEFKSGINFIHPIEVHHIIPACQETALYLDLDNLVTLCKKCHSEIHSTDKHKFSRRL